MQPLCNIGSYNSFFSVVFESICSLFLPAAFLSINQTHIITGCVFMFEKKTISTNAKEDIKGASEIFS